MEKIRIGVICYDLQNFTADFLNRLADATRSYAKVTAYPIMDSIGDIDINFEYSLGQSVQKHRVKTYAKNDKHTPEGILLTPNIRNAIRCSLNSDLILHYGIHSSTALISGFVGWLLGRRQISVNQTIPVFWERRRKWWIRWNKQIFFRFCECHVAQSRISIDNLNEVYSIKKEKIHYIPFEAGVHAFKKKFDECERVPDINTIKSKNGITLLFVGNLLKFKGVYLLIDAVRNLIGRGFGYSLLIVGPESIEKTEPRIIDLQNHVKLLGLDRNIKILGPKSLNELVPIYSESDIFVLPTMKDCFPKVMVEAGVAGKPMISSDACGAVGTILINNVNGIVFKAGSVESLEVAILDISDPDKLKKMSCETIKIMEDYLDETSEEEVLFSRIIYDCYFN